MGPTTKHPGAAQLKLSDYDACIDEILERMSLRSKLAHMWQPDWRALRTSGACFSRLELFLKILLQRLPSCLHRALTPLADRCIAGPNGPLRGRGVAPHFSEWPLGSVLGGGGACPYPNEASAWRQQAEVLQAAARAETSGVGLLIGTDAVHGHHSLRGSVLFPHHIGQGCMRDPELVCRLAEVAAAEAFACGNNLVFSPCVAVAGDLRWGRTFESFAEDPGLVSQLAAAEVEGLQRSGFPVAACAKHFVADGATAVGTGTPNFAWMGAAPDVRLDQGDARLSDAELRRRHVAPYAAAVAAGVLTVMASYSAVNGQKVHASYELLTRLLKAELGFDGVVISDYDAVQQCGDEYEAAVAACINAGVDIVMTSGGIYSGMRWQEQLAAAERAVKAGLIPMARIDDAVRRILRVKAALGLLPTSGAAGKAVAPAKLPPSPGCADHRAVARLAVSKSCVLLRNEGGVLPLDPRRGRLFVAGRAADDLGIQCGGWSMQWEGFRGNKHTQGTTVWQAVKAAVPAAALLDTAAAMRGVPGGGAADDVALVCTGEEPYVEGGGDASDLTMPEAELVRALAASGARVVVVLICGRPLVIPPEVLAQIHGLLVAWLPGTEGAGVTDVLFGECPVSGRLSFSWPRDMEQARFEDRYSAALFPFGFGLTT